MSIATAVTNLDRLNELLSKEKLNIPEYRRQVSLSGSNLQWLRRAIERKEQASDEVRQLVALDIGRLLLPYSLPEQKVSPHTAPHDTIQKMT